MTRIFLLGPGESRAKWSMWVEFEITEMRSVYVKTIRRHYRKLRKAGLYDFEARDVIYGLLVAGGRMRRCENYGRQR